MNMEFTVIKPEDPITPDYLRISRKRIVIPRGTANMICGNMSDPQIVYLHCANGDIYIAGVPRGGFEIKWYKTNGSINCSQGITSMLFHYRNGYKPEPGAEYKLIIKVSKEPVQLGDYRGFLLIKH